MLCGGRGTRLDSEAEKPLFRIRGVPMVDRVLAALRDSAVGTVYAVTSPNAPATRAHVEVPCIETPGEGYVADLQRALDAVERPVLTVAADLPLLDGPAVEAVLRARERRGADSLTVVVPAAVKRRLGTSVDDRAAFALDGADRELLPAGVNVVGGPEDTMHTSDDVRHAVNVNRRGDVAVAEALL